MTKRIASTVLCLVMVVVALGLGASVASAHPSPKSIYLVADHHADPTPINAYNIGPAGCCDLTYQATYPVVSHNLGASGLAMYEDPDGDGFFDDAQILVTYEASNLIEVFYATDLTPVPGTPITAVGASDLAGIVVDQEKQLIYTVDRYTQNLFVYDANTFAPAVGALPILLTTLDDGAVGLALDEQRDWLFVTDFDSTVHYFDTATWMQVGTITTDSAIAIGIAVDEQLQFVYTGGAFAGDNLMAKYDMTTGTATHVDLAVVSGIPDCGAMGLAVDLDSHCLYVTTGYGGDDLRVFDSDLNQLCVYPDAEGMIINPAGIIIPREEVVYNPLHLTKDDGLAGACVDPGDDITYTISYDNTANAYEVNNVTITDNLPPETSFVSATGVGVYDAGTHTVTWDVGTLPAGDPGGSEQLVVNVDPATAPGTVLDNTCTIDSDETPPTTVHKYTTVCEEGPGPAKVPGITGWGTIAAVLTLGGLMLVVVRRRGLAGG